MCGVAPLAKVHPVPEAKTENTLFGADDFVHLSGYTAPVVGGNWSGGGSGTGAGVFHRHDYYWATADD